MKINEFIQKYRTVTKLVPGMTSSHTPKVVCNDGFEMSVQAGQSLYSEPRDVADSYEEAEVGFPSTEESLLTSYAEDEEKVDEEILNRHDRRQMEMFDDPDMNWSGQR